MTIQRMGRGLVLVALIVLAVAAMPALAKRTSGKSDDDLVWDLCDGTMSALESTQAAPLAAQFSAEAGSFLFVKGKEALHLSRAQMLKMSTWAKQPAFSRKAEVSPIMSEPPGGEFSHLVGMAMDGGKDFWLDGITVREGGVRKWLLLTVLPHAAVVTGKELDTFRLALKPFFAALADCYAKAMGDLLAPDVAMRMPTANGERKVFATAAAFEAELNRIKNAGGISLNNLDMTEGVLAPAAAAVTVACKMAVGGGKPEDVVFTIQLHLEGGQWRVVGISAT